MTHRTRILADRLIATPVAFLFNGLARVLGAVMRRDHSMTSANVNRIVVAKLIGMGSILQATPLLKALKRRYPHCTLTFVTMRSNRGAYPAAFLAWTKCWCSTIETFRDADHYAYDRRRADSAPGRLVFRFGIVFGLRVVAGAMRGDAQPAGILPAQRWPSRTGFTLTWCTSIRGCRCAASICSLGAWPAYRRISRTRSVRFALTNRTVPACIACSRKLRDGNLQSRTSRSIPTRRTCYWSADGRTTM